MVQVQAPVYYAYKAEMALLPNGMTKDGENQGFTDEGQTSWLHKLVIQNHVIPSGLNSNTMVGLILLISLLMMEQHAW